MGIPVTIRMAREDDVPALLAIYAPYVTDTAITFEYEVPDAAEFIRRMRRILARYPYLAAESEEGVLGYAYAAPSRSAPPTTGRLRRPFTSGVTAGEWGWAGGSTGSLRSC